MLTAFEGRDYVNTDGERMFSSVVTTEQDEPLIKTYILQALNILGERFQRMIVSINEDTDSLTWSLRTEQTRYPNTQAASLKKHLDEAVASYVMMNWLADKKADRVAMYTELWNGSAELAFRNIFRKAAPQRRVKNYADIDEVTIKVV